MNLKAVSAAAAIAMASYPAAAAEIIGTRGGWEVFQDSRSCGMTMDYDGPGETQMTVLRYADGNMRVMITNTAWSAKPDELYDISYHVNGTVYAGAKAVGTGSRGRKGFVSTFAASFAEDFAKGATLRVLLSDEEIERLSLTGSGAAMALVDQCLLRMRASTAAADREMEKRAQLPKDPFARPSRDSEQ